MKRLAHDNPDIFHCMVFIDVEITFGLNSESNKSMLGHQLQHVVEKPNAHVDLALSAAVQRPLDANVGFLGGSMQPGLSGGGIFFHVNLPWADFAYASDPSIDASRVR